MKKSDIMELAVAILLVKLGLDYAKKAKNETVEFRTHTKNNINKLVNRYLLLDERISALEKKQP